MDSPILRAEHNEFVKRMEDEHSRMNARISEVESKANTLLELTASVESIAARVKTLTEKVEVLEQKPADNWNTVVKGLLTGLGSNIAALLLGALAVMYFFK